MWLSLILGRIAGVWRGLPASWRGFILGTVVGTTLLSGSCALMRGSDSKEKIAVENLRASLDSTRAISAQHDTVYARLIAQKDVELSGALATVAHKQGDKPKAVVAVNIRGRGVDTVAVHYRLDPLCQARCRTYNPTGLCYEAGKPGSVPCPAGFRDSVSLAHRAPATDSLVIAGPPVVGTVSATVTDSTWIWSARLRPSPVDITLALTCGKNGPEILGQGPPGVPWSIGYKGGAVDPAVCHPAPSKWTSGFRSGVVVTAGSYVVFRVVKSLLAKGK